MAPRTLLVYLLGILILAAANGLASNEDDAQTTTAAAVTETTAVEQEQEQPTATPTEKGDTCVCNCDYPDRDEAQCGTEAGTTQTQSTDTTVSEDDGSNDTTDYTSTTEDPTSKPDTTTVTASESTADTTTPTPSPPLETSSIPEPTNPPCAVQGLQGLETDCRAYNECSSSGSNDGSLRLTTKFCADNEAFSAEFGRCSRDISSCDNAVVCLSKGSVADPVSNSSYYICEPRLATGQIMVFHVKCAENELFYPELGRCFVDFLNGAQPPFWGFPPYNWNVVRDIDLVRAELKLIREHDKLKLKQEKERLKAEKKLQKEKEKEAKRLAKERAKLLEEQLKQESAQFVCVEAGNFPSSVSDSAYFSCTLKKMKFKLTVQKCPLGSKFNADRALCTWDLLPGAGASPLESEEDNSDDED